MNTNRCHKRNRTIDFLKGAGNAIGVGKTGRNHFKMIKLSLRCELSTIGEDLSLSHGHEGNNFFQK